MTSNIITQGTPISRNHKEGNRPMNNKHKVTELTQDQNAYLDKWYRPEGSWYHFHISRTEYTAMNKAAGGDTSKLNEYFLKVLQHGLAQEKLYTDDPIYKSLLDLWCAFPMEYSQWGKIKFGREAPCSKNTYLAFQCDRLTERMITLAAINYYVQGYGLVEGRFSISDAIDAIVHNGLKSMRESGDEQSIIISGEILEMLDWYRPSLTPETLREFADVLEKGGREALKDFKNKVCYQMSDIAFDQFNQARPYCDKNVYIGF